MSNTDDLFSLIKNNASLDGKLPPVENWHPENCGEMDLTIRANGEWVHQGTPIGREKLFQLFSTVLRKDESQYFLVTPVEKIEIQVDWQPFVIVDFEVVKNKDNSVYLFTDNCKNKIILTKQEQLRFSKFEDQELPIILVRKNLYASFSRSCYYRLVESARITEKNEKNEKNEKTQVSIQSNNNEFVLGEFIVSADL